MRRQVHTRYRGQSNRKGRKVVNLRLSQWKRRHGIPAHEQLAPMDYLKAAYGSVMQPFRVCSRLFRVLARERERTQ